MDMVSKVAEALASSFRETVERVSGDSWEETGVTLPSKALWERYARAAIEAMKGADLSEMRVLLLSESWERAEELWLSVIDAALSPPPPSSTSVE